MEKFWLLLKEPYKEESSIHPYPEEAPAYPAAMKDDKPTAVAYSRLQSRQRIRRGWDACRPFARN
jgi:hypothetical protein